MTKLLKIKFFILYVAVFFTSSFVRADDTCGFNVLQRSGEIVHWEKLPVPFYMHESVSVPAHHIFVSAVKHWNRAWENYLKDKGVEYFPLLAVPKAKFQYANNPKRDGYNMIFFARGDGMDKLIEYKTQKESIWRGIFYRNRNGNLFTDYDFIINNVTTHFFYDTSFVIDVDQNSNQNRKPSSIKPLNLFLKLKQKIRHWFSFFEFSQKSDRQIASGDVTVVPKGQVDFANIAIGILGEALGLRRGATWGLNMPQSWHTRRVRRDIAQEDLDNIFCAYVKKL